MSEDKKTTSKQAASAKVNPTAEVPKANQALSKPKTPPTSVWETWLKPVVVLAIICLITSALLGITNGVTKPLIEQNAAAAEDAARKELLPSAASFEDVTPTPLPENILSVYKASGDAGYVIGAFGKGYGGKVPALVAINADGKIAGIQFLENNETPGLGKKLVTDEGFAAQFKGKAADEPVGGESIDGITAATLSTNAALTAVNAATEYYNIKLMGGTLAYDLPEEALQQLMPNAISWQQLTLKADKIAGAYLGDDGTFVLVAQGKGEKTLYAAVAVDTSGTITGLWLDTSKETQNYGLNVDKDQAYMSQYIGQTDTTSVQMIAGVTHTSEGISGAVDAALAAFPAAKEAA